MAISLPVDFLLLLLLFVFLIQLNPSWAAPQSYVVYMGVHDTASVPQPDSIFASHLQVLATVVGSNEAAQKSIFYSYQHYINGFAASLEPHHASAISAVPGVVSVFPNRAHTLQTTRSWEFLGLENPSGDVPDNSLWKKANYGKDVIIGVLDTGIWPESESFNDGGFGPIPDRWKGTCVEGMNFTSFNCNRKLIGARYFIKGYESVRGPLDLNSTGEFLSARDNYGHGTHTSSTAAGRFVGSANVFGIANGTAKGGAPMSRLAMYKICWPEDCYDADILAAFDAGIKDGVDIFSLSLGAPAKFYSQDGVAIGSFHAVSEGKLVVCSAGNSGPSPSSVINVAPWILTVAASSIDRSFQAAAILGNGMKYIGGSISKSALEKRMYPLVSGMDVKCMDANDTASKLCFPGSLDPTKTKGKIVACMRGVIARVEKGIVVKNAGGVGMILCNKPLDENDIIVSDPHVLPATHLNAHDGASIFHYINIARSTAVGYIDHPSTILGVKPAPQMAIFSSQGPNKVTPDILKPDITAPGLNILASWSQTPSPLIDNRITKFNLISGTSMSCPHISGVVALLRVLHPTWSPAAIKSAIMTTAAQYDNSEQHISNASLQIATPFNYGSGHVNPNAAVDPGLIYNASTQDYFLFMCNINYTQSQFWNISRTMSSSWSCPKNRSTVADLNYPSISLSNLEGNKSVIRTVTYVGGGNIYQVDVRPPRGVDVEIIPCKLEFKELGETLRFSINFRVLRASKGQYVFGHFTWTDGSHHVRSPIAVIATLPS